MAEISMYHIQQILLGRRYDITYVTTPSAVFVGENATHPEVRKEHELERSDCVDEGRLEKGERRNTIVVQGKSWEDDLGSEEGGRPITVSFIRQLVQGHQPPIAVIYKDSPPKLTYTVEFYDKYARGTGD